MGKTPKLSLSAIKSRIDAGSFQRGEAYFRDGMIFDTRRQGSTLKARCEGSQGGPYRVEVAFDGDKITNADCSCPAGGGGFCKHVAALLLTWRARPEKFVEVEEVEADLGRRSKSELIGLVKLMFRREPELESLLSAPVPGSKTKPASPDAYRRQTIDAIRNVERDDRWGYGRPDASGDLRLILETGGAFLTAKDYASASIVYEGLVGGVAEESGSFYDDQGEVFDLVSDCVKGLGQCLEHLKDDPARREGILRALLDADDYAYDSDLDTEEDISELIARLATREERREVAGWIRSRMAEAKDWDSQYQNEYYTRFLLVLEGEDLDDETFLRICRDGGLTAKLLDRLLSLGRVDEAVAEWRKASQYGYLAYADLFVQHGQSEVAERLMLEQAEAEQTVGPWQWLRHRARSRRDKAALRALTETIFRLQPSFEDYRELRKNTPKKEWEALRSKLVDRLIKRHDNYCLIRIYLDEGDIEQAIGVVNAERGPYGSEMAMEVAKAAEKKHPREAIAIYKKKAEAYIDARGRGNYQEACKVFRKVRDLYTKLGESDEWEYYVGVLRERNRSLAAFKQELEAAKL